MKRYTHVIQPQQFEQAYQLTYNCFPQNIGINTVEGEELLIAVYFNTEQPEAAIANWHQLLDALPAVIE